MDAVSPAFESLRQTLADIMSTGSEVGAALAAPWSKGRGVLAAIDRATLDPTSGRRHDASLDPVWWQRT
jgi:hypothetical protein